MRRIKFLSILLCGWLHAQPNLNETELNSFLANHGNRNIQISDSRLTYKDTIRHLFERSYSKPVSGSIDLTKSIVFQKTYQKERSTGYVTLVCRGQKFDRGEETNKLEIAVPEVTPDQFQRFVTTLQAYGRKKKLRIKS